MPMDDMSQFLDLFVQESQDRFIELNQSLVRLEDNPHDEEILYSILRNVHSLKGSAGMFGFEYLKQIAHRLEDLMDVVHKKPDLVTREIMDTLFEGCDILDNRFKRVTTSGTSEPLLPRERAFLDHMENRVHALGTGGATLEGTASVLLKVLEQHFTEIEGVMDAAPLRKAAAHLRQALAVDAGDGEDAGEVGETLLLNGTPVTGALHTLHTLLPLAENRTLSEGEVASFFAALEELLAAAKGCAEPAVTEAVAEAREAMEVFSELDLDFDALQFEFYTEFLRALAPFVESVAPEVEEAAQDDDEAAGVEASAGAGQGGATAGAQGTEAGSGTPLLLARKTVRIDEAKIDAFLDSVGEMIILGEVFNHLQKRMAGVIGTDHLALMREFKGANNEFSKHVFSLQDSLMNVRRVEIRNVTGSLARLVRDTSRSLGREIDLHVEGEDAVIDKSLLDDLNTCLVHLVRNACDHGIEAPEVRVAAGKPAGGRITVSAENEGGNLFLRVEDDGGGIDTERIRAELVARGMRSPQEASQLPEKELQRLIFEDGFTTAEAVSDISGRGVGMSVVMENIRRIGGGVDVDSRPGRGTTVTLRIPLSVMLSVVDGLIVQVAEAGFVIPVRHVIQSFHVTAGDILPVKGKGECIRLRGRIYAMHRLSDLFDIRKGTTVHRPDRGVGILLQNDHGEMCVFVDTILDHQQVVIKEIEGLGTMRGFLGGSLLGDGTIGLVLDVEALDP